MRAPLVSHRLRNAAEAVAPRVEQAEAALKPHVNRAVLAVGVLYPLAMGPQLYNVWALHRTAGLSEVTYGLGLVAALSWTAWGVLHRERTIWMLNTVWVGVHAAMIAGLLR